MVMMIMKMMAMRMAMLERMIKGMMVMGDNDDDANGDWDADGDDGDNVSGSQCVVCIALKIHSRQGFVYFKPECTKLYLLHSKH